MKKVTCFVLALALGLFMSAAAFAEDSDDVLGKLGGTYKELFTEICAPAYDQVWLDACAKQVDATQVEAVAAMLKNACVGTLYGEEALVAYAEKPEEAQFNCFFINGVAQFTIEGNIITGVDKEGATVFTHAYNFVGLDDSFGMDMAVYESADADSGEFTYFLFAPDVPADTFHIEFRYGDDLEMLNKMMEGKYAYWLAAGIPVENTADYAEKAIQLFCEENLAAEDEAA